jgi:uncharacterized protein (DUF302 family)
MADHTPIVHSSAHPYAETVSTLVAAIAHGGATLFATIDQQAAAQSVGMSLRPTTLLVFGNPKGGTPLMDAFPLAALDLPLKLLIWEAPDGVKVAYTPPSEIASRYDVTGKDALIAAMSHQLETLVAAIA